MDYGTKFFACTKTKTPEKDKSVLSSLAWMEAVEEA